MMTYFEKIEKLHHDIVDATLDTEDYTSEEDVRKLLQNQVLRTFIDGLLQACRIILKSRNPTNLDQALAISVKEEVSFRSNRETSKMVSDQRESNQQKIRLHSNHGSSSKACFKCGRTNHIAKDCRAQVWDQENYSITRKPSQQSRGTPRASVLIICRYCKKEGHKLEENRKRKFVNDKKVQDKQDYVSSSTHERTSGNEQTPGASGGRPVGKIKTATLSMQELYFEAKLVERHITVKRPQCTTMPILKCYII